MIYIQFCLCFGYGIDHLCDQIIHTLQGYFIATWGLFYWHGLTLIPAWIIDYFHFKVWYKSTYSPPVINDGTVEVWKWISFLRYIRFMLMTSWHGHSFCITGPLCGEPTDHQWIILQNGTVVRNFDGFVVLSMNKLLDKQPSCRYKLWHLNTHVTYLKRMLYTFDRLVNLTAILI